MENYSYPSYPDSVNSSPRSREIDYDNQPWDEQQQQQQNYKAKFMCSYGGKINPRPHDNQLSYIGGETKILAVDRTIRFPVMITKLAALSGEADVAFKYQLPGEELDALISVTNDDDLDNMMHEYDRLYRSSGRPSRMRLFLFPASPGSTGISGSIGAGQPVGSERDKFVEALNSASAPVDPPKPVQGSADFLFGLEKGVVAHPPPPLPVLLPDPVGPVAAAPHEPRAGLTRDDRVFGSDHGVSPAEIQRQLQELQRLQISAAQEQEVTYRRKSEEALIGGSGGGGEYYVQKVPERSNSIPVPIPSSVPISSPPGYWPDKQIPSGAFIGAVTGQPEQPMYVIPGHGGFYHAPQMTRPITGQPASHGYYAVQQRPGPDAHQDQPLFNVTPAPPPGQQPAFPMAAPSTLPSQQQLQRVAAAASTEGIMTGRSGSGAADHMAYATVGYDGVAGRQFFYTAGGGVVAGPPHPQYQGMVAVAADGRPVGPVSQDGKVIAKVSRASS